MAEAGRGNALDGGRGTGGPTCSAVRLDSLLAEQDRYKKRVTVVTAAPRRDVVAQLHWSCEYFLHISPSPVA